MNISEKEYKKIINNKNNKKSLKSENNIQTEIRDFLKWNGWFVIRHQQSLGSLKGLSDLSAIKNGLTIYIEVKTEKGKQSDYQKEFQNEIENHGGKYILARKLEDIITFLKGLKNT